MIQHVYQRASAARQVAAVVVLTDDQRVLDTVEGFGGRCEMTPADCASGTDRIAAAAAGWSADAIINVQGDEPLLEPSDVELLARHLVAHPDEPMVTLAAPATDHELADPNTVKVVTAASGRALYFSRAAIPHPRVRNAVKPLRHIGIYGYQRRTLLELARLEPTPLERCEALEQLRALENGIPIRVLLTEHSGIGVDTEEDLQRAEEQLSELAAGDGQRRHRLYERARRMPG